MVNLNFKNIFEIKLFKIVEILIGDFIIIVWISFRSFKPWSTIFNFGNECLSNRNLIIGLHKNTTWLDIIVLFKINKYLRLEVCTYDDEVNSECLIAKKILNLNQWYHIAYRIDGNKGSIFLNGDLVANGTQLRINHKTSNNYICRNCILNNDIDAFIYSVKIIQYAPSNKMIMFDYSHSFGNKSIRDNDV